MTKDEALKLALETLEQLDGIDTETECVTIDVGDVIDAIKEVLAQPEQCQCPNCRVTLHASDCAVHNEPAYPKWACNCGAQPEQEPVAKKKHEPKIDLGKYAGTYGGYTTPEQEPVLWAMPDGKTVDKWALQFYGGQKGKPLYTTPPQRKPQEFVCSTGLCHYRKPLTNDRAHQILLDMAKHIETFGDENITEQALSAECIRFILERVTAYGIKEEV